MNTQLALAKISVRRLRADLWLAFNACWVVGSKALTAGNIRDIGHWCLGTVAPQREVLYLLNVVIFFHRTFHSFSTGQREFSTGIDDRNAFGPFLWISVCVLPRSDDVNFRCKKF